MPPRTRKTAAPAPDAVAEATGGAVQAAEPVMFGDGDPEVVVPAGSGNAEQAPDQPAKEEPGPVAVAAVTYHWQQADGRPGSPCRLCAPAGPPVGAGSFGCGHGQWVLVAGDA